MDKHLNILKQLLGYWWDKDSDAFPWDELNEDVKNNALNIFVYEKFKGIEQWINIQTY